MKTVFANREIPHLWAHQAQDHARGHGSVSFQGATIYSYQTAMGRVLKKGVAVILNRGRYSNTTSRHQSRIWSAVDHYPHIFQVNATGRGDVLRDIKPKDIANQYIDKAVECLEEAPRRKAHGAELNRGYALEHIAKANDAISYFHLHRKPVTVESLAKRVAKLAAERKARRIIDSKQTRARNKIKRAEQIARAEAWIAKPSSRSILTKWECCLLPAEVATRLHQAEDALISQSPTDRAQAYLANQQGKLNHRDIEALTPKLRQRVEAKEEADKRLDAERDALAFIKGESRTFSSDELLTPETLAAVNEKRIANERERIAAWLAGTFDGRLSPDCPVYLRHNGEAMETSKGATVPIQDAERAFRFAVTMRAKGWHRNGSTHAIGHYELDAINDFGVVAGCHRVSWGEIERFAKVQGWIGAAS